MNGTQKAGCALFSFPVQSHAQPTDAQKLFLLHGFPSAGHIADTRCTVVSEPARHLCGWINISSTTRRSPSGQRGVCCASDRFVCSRSFSWLSIHPRKLAQKRTESLRRFRTKSSGGESSAATWRTWRLERATLLCYCTEILPRRTCGATCCRTCTREAAVSPRT